ncbi:MAG: hypothetical protein ACRDTM_01975 [Micromonosporaceae bacterium]
MITYTAEPEHWRNEGSGPAVSDQELHRWRQCRMTDRRAVLRIAFTRIEIDVDGQAHRVWRHRTDTTEAVSR